MIKDTSGPAFPCDLAMYDQEVVDAYSGMTLRDYFAAKAMQGLIATSTQFTMGSAGLAELAFDQADAMLKARKM
jgi:hypothetical protein